MITDPIADMLTRIRNAAARSFPTVEVPYSRLKAKIADLMLKNGWFDKIEIIKKDPGQSILLTYRYYHDQTAIRGLQRISKPGQRIYMNHSQLTKRYPNRLEMIVISTSKGLVTRDQAVSKGLGGEVMFKVW